MKQEGQFLLFTREEFKSWLFNSQFKRKVKLIQNHHTYLPDYQSFSGSNHFDMLNSMRDYHIKQEGFADIAQNLTTFPDGTIALCRNFERDPAGIYGANTGAICIEHVGNFNKDNMTEEHKKSIVFLNSVLCICFGLTPSTDAIVYHHWYDLDTGRRTNGTGLTKTCPGIKFFGGNTVEACQTNFMPLIKKAIGESSMEWKEIVKKVASSPEEWEKAIEAAVNAAKAEGDLGALEIFRFLPQLIEKIYNTKGV